MRYSGCNSGSDYPFPDRFPGFCGSCVHANKKYRLNRLFFENNRFNRDFNLLFHSLFGGSFLTISGGFLRETACKRPWEPSIAITSEKMAFERVFEGGRILFCGRLCALIFQKYFLEIFIKPGKLFSGFFQPIKFSWYFFSGSKSFFIWRWLLHYALKLCHRSKENQLSPTGSRVLRLSQIRRHVEKRINLIAAKRSENLGDAKTIVFKLCDGTADIPVYALVPAYHVCLLYTSPSPRD